jgi:transcriptional regulator with XRE-family HTH domain
MTLAILTSDDGAEYVQCKQHRFDRSVDLRASEMAESRSLGEAIRLRRLELGMSQEELAERIGADVRQSDVSRLERGKILFPCLERLNQIATALGMSIGTLLVEAGWFTDEDTAEIVSADFRETSRSVPIVVADDEPVSLEAIVSLLGDYGYSAATAYDLGTLTDILTESSPEIVLVDIALPGLNPELLEKLVASLHPSSILVFMGSGLPEIEVEGPYLEKPIDSRQLLALVGSIEKRRPVLPSRFGSDNGHLAEV